MTTDLETHLRAYYAAWSRQDVDAVLSFFTDASTFEDLAFEARFEGRAQIRSFVDYWNPLEFRRSVGLA